MSYILDALKRAEAERSRGEIPDLHAQPLGDLPGADVRTPAVSRGRWLGGAAAILLLGGAGGWWLSRDGASEPAVAVRSAPAPLSPANPAAVLNAPAVPPAVALATAVQGASAGVAPAAPPPAPTITLAPAPVTETELVAPPAPTGPSKAKALATAAASAAKADALVKAGAAAADTAAAPAGNAQPGGAAGGVAAAPALAVTAISPAASPTAVSPDEKIVALRDLPDDVRASLPQLSVAGATYSENPASRMLIINGKLVHEGDRLTPELTLQQIRLRSAVLSFRGTRFSISY